MIPRLSFGQLWLAVAVLLPVVASLATPLSTVDLAYHVRVGAGILDTGRIPAVDELTFTAAGRPWLDQQWLAQLVFATVHRVTGWEGLAVLRALLVGVLFGLVVFACRASGADRRTAAWLTLGAFVVALPTLALRPQLLGMALFATCLAILAARRREPRLVWLLALLAAVWANVHGSFVLAPVVVAVAWLEEIRLRTGHATWLGVIGLVTLAATLISPFGIAAWAYAAGLTTNPLVTERISEWQPTSLRTFTGLAFFASAGLVALFLARRPERTPWPALGWLGLLFLFGVYAERGVAWWPIGAAVTVAELLAADRRQAPTPAPVDARASRLNGATVVALVVVAIVLLPWWRPTEPFGGRAGLLSDAPTIASAVIEHTESGDRLFVPQRWGSWFEWVVPDRPVFVDSRVELFPIEVWSDEAAIGAGLVDWQDVLDRWQVDAVVVEAASGELGVRLHDAGWTEVASDPSGRLFVRR